MLEDAWGCLRMLEDAWGCLMMIEDASGCLSMLGGHLGIIFGCFGSHLEIKMRSRGQLEPERLGEGENCFFVSGLAIRASTPHFAAEW